MKTLKKTLALLLAVMMCMSLLSVAAFADDVYEFTEATSWTEGMTYYASNEGDGGEGITFNSQEEFNAYQGGTLYTRTLQSEPSDPPAAADPDYDHPLTVTGLKEGDTVTFYKIVGWAGDAQGNVGGWAAVSPYNTILTSAKLREVLVGDPNATPPVNPTSIGSELAGQLAALASTDGVDGTINNKIATLDNPGPGLWMAIVTPGDADTIYNPVFVAADYIKSDGGTVAVSDVYDYDGVAKSSTIPLTKTAANTSDYNSDNGQTAAVGDVLTFTVTTAIPAYGEVYTNPCFKLSDSLVGMKLEKDATDSTKYDIVVNNVPATYKDAEDNDQPTYTISATDTGYTITFAPDYLKTVKAGISDVTVVYKAKITSEAALQINQEDNEVTLEYSHNPNQQDDHDLKKDTTQHYTFTLDAQGDGSGQTINGKKTSEVVKVGVDAAGNPITNTIETSAITGTETWTGPLKDAEFGLWKNANCTGDPYLTQTTGADGRMTFAGLDAGTYYLKEISAPTGYVTSNTVHTVVIAAETDTVKVTEWWTGSEWVSTKPASGTAEEVTYETEILKSYTVTIDGEETATYTFTNQATANSNDINWTTVDAEEHPFELTNTQGTELPSTGGIGTKVFYTMGAVLVVGAGVILVSRKRAGE